MPTALLFLKYATALSVQFSNGRFCFHLPYYPRLERTGIVRVLAGYGTVMVIKGFNICSVKLTIKETMNKLVDNLGPLLL